MDSLAVNKTKGLRGRMFAPRSHLLHDERWLLLCGTVAMDLLSLTDYSDIGGLRTFGTLGDFEFNHVAFF